jgi:PIN domain nuclease of toxin-antitoxin system
MNHICLPVISQVSLIPKRMIKDPWDRVIMATSKYLDIPLMTKDKNISKSGLLNVVW